MQKILILLFLPFVALSLKGQKSLADSLYTSQHYQEALSSYVSLLENGENADVHYNLANCYYRMENIAPAILHYEKALKLNPMHEDARYNLDICRTKIGCEADIQDEMFFMTMFRKWITSRNANQWMNLGVVFFILTIIAWFAYAFMSYVTYRKIAFCTLILFAAITLLFNIFAMQAKDAFYANNRVVVMQETQFLEGPTKQARNLGTLTPGATYETDIQQGSDWLRLKFPDGTVGWCECTNVEFI